MNAVQLTQAKQALLRDLDRALQHSCHQRLGEVINDLRVHDITLTPNPTPDEIFDLVRRTHLLSYSTRPEVVTMRDSIERLCNGTYGVCARCGSAIEADALACDPETPFCRSCTHRPRRATGRNRMPAL